MAPSHPASAPVTAAVERLLPHRPPARLIDEVVTRDENRVVCRGTISRDAVTADDETASVVLALEMGAQAAAFLLGQQGAAESSSVSGKEASRIGYLVSIRQAAFHRMSLPVGAPLLTTVSLHGKAGELVMFDVQVAAEAEPEVPLVEARLSTFLEPPSSSHRI